MPICCAVIAARKQVTERGDLWYSGFVYRLLGIPQDLFTPMFAVSRIAGWCAHRFEELGSGKRIIRPAYKSVSKERDYVALDDRN